MEGEVESSYTTLHPVIFVLTTNLASSLSNYYHAGVNEAITCFVGCPECGTTPPFSLPFHQRNPSYPIYRTTLLNPLSPTPPSNHPPASRLASCQANAPIPPSSTSRLRPLTQSPRQMFRAYPPSECIRTCTCSPLDLQWHAELRDDLHVRALNSGHQGRPSRPSAPPLTSAHERGAR